MQKNTKKKNLSDYYTSANLTKGANSPNARTATVTDGAKGNGKSYVSSGNGTQTSAKSPSDYYGYSSSDLSFGQAAEDEIQKALDNRDYKTFLNAQIYNYNLKQQAQKYYNNSLANQGMASQGYGTSAHIGIENAYANANATALSDYYDSKKNNYLDALDRQEQAETELDNQLVTYLSNSTDQESLDKYMANYGYVQASDGKWYKANANGEADTSSPASSYIQSAYDMASNNLGGTSNAYNPGESTQYVNDATNFLNQYRSNYAGVDANGYASVDDLYNVEVGRADNKKTGTLDEVVGNELDYLKSRIATGTVENGTLFKLQRGSNKKDAYLILYLNGRFYLCSDDDREQEGYQVSSRYNLYQGPKEEIVAK